MKWMARCALGVTVLFIPAVVGASSVAQGASDPAQGHQTTTSRTGPAIDKVAAVGALFTMNDGELGTHFCTASVVHSSHGDLAVTAAHCLAAEQGQIVFVPDYANGKEPYGVWPVAAVYTDQAWQSAQNPDDDFAFLRLSDSGDGMPIEDVTGAERLGTSWQQPAFVKVIGYPNAADQPISCTNWTKIYSPKQLEFDCAGYTDGTSGGPFLADVSAETGQGTVIGVIGGYEQGGDTPAVSYAAAFGPAVTALYQSAEAGG